MNRYFYIDREEAKIGVTLMVATSYEAIINFEQFLGNGVIEFVGEDVPHYITYLEGTDTIRESTLEENVARGFIELGEFQVIIDDIIYTYNPSFQKLEGGVIMDKTRVDYRLEGTITIESEKALARTKRDELFLKFDKVVAHSNFGIIILSPEIKTEIINWRSGLIELIENYTEIATPLLDLFPTTPQIIEDVI